ncbi:MAG: pyridoxal phosphate-dependent aminotransferase [Candidatus Hermodarchaeia archaeon]|jgi:aminotransferase
MPKSVKTAARLQGVSPSGLREFFEIGAKLSAKGVDVISLGIGDLDLPLPPFLSDAIADAFATGQTHYSSNAGILELRQAIADRYQTTYDLEYAPEEVLVTCGALEGLLDTMLAFINPGDRVLVQDPAFGYFSNQAKLAGAEVELIPMTSDFDLDVERYRVAFEKKTPHMVIINSPCNPTGSVASEKNVKEIVELAAEHDSILISDECYEFLRYDGNKHVCAATFNRDNVIIINSFSKALAMTGLRLGYVVAPVNLMQPIYQVHQYNTACAPTPIQVGAMKTLANPKAFKGIIGQHRNVLNDRLKVALESFKPIKGFKFSYEPVAGFYLFPNVEGTGMTGPEFAISVLEEKGVVVVPGDQFGEAYPNNIRISVGSAPPNRIREAASRVADFVQK